MQENRIDGSQVVTPNAGIEEIKKALDDPRNKSIYLHAPGQKFKLKDGTEYLVGAKGTIHKISPKARRPGHSWKERKP
jgi:hypothetical protein